MFCFYSWVEYHELTLKECLSNPEPCHGATLRVGNESKARHVQNDRFELVKGTERITVYGAVNGLLEDDHVELNGIFHKEGYLELRKIYVRKLRQWKIVLSVLPIFLVAWMLSRKYRFDTKKRLFVER
jgi:hypothetical protein